MTSKFEQCSAHLKQRRSDHTQQKSIVNIAQQLIEHLSMPHLKHLKWTISSSLLVGEMGEEDTEKRDTDVNIAVNGIDQTTGYQ